MKTSEKMQRVWLSYRHKVLPPDLYDLTELELKKAFFGGMMATLQLEEELHTAMIASGQAFVDNSTVTPMKGKHNV